MPQADGSEGSDDEMVTRQDGGIAPAADGPREHAQPHEPGDRDDLGGPGEPAQRPFRVGRYTILRSIGRGGMGVVYAAYDDRLDRKVALKLVHVSREDGSIGQARLLREAQALARLSHPNVVQVYEVGEHARQVYLAMEFVRGVTLRDWTRARPHPWRETLATFVQAARGLAAAHAAGLVHRDFKPDNALLADDGRVRVLDFGLARALAGEADEPPTTSVADVTRSAAATLDTQDLSHPLTAAGQLLGTPAYMSPEQLRRRATDARSDQYSFCVALWEALYGARPFTGRNLGELKRHVFAAAPRPPRGGPAPAYLGRVLVRGLALAPEQRYPDMDALLAALADDPAIRRRRRALAAAAALTLAAVGAGGYALATHHAEPAPTACDGAAALADVWDPAQRDAVAARFTAADLPFAEQAFTSTAALLDAHADALEQLLRGTCEARRHGVGDSRALDLQVACGERRRGELAALVAVLREADAPVIERASQAAARLPPVSGCTDLEALFADAEQAPSDPALAARVVAQREGLAAARAHLDAGHPPRARLLAGEVVTEAERLDHPPLLAEALVARGAAEAAGGDYPLAVQSLHRGFAVAEAAGQDTIAADAAIRLVHIHGERLSELARAQTWAELADAKLERIGDDGSQRVRLLFYAANSLLDAGRLQESEPQFRAAMALAERRRDLDPNFYVIALNALATLEIERGALAEAEPLLRRSLALREAALGPSHPQVAVVLHNLALVLYHRRELAASAEHFQRALAIRERSLGSDHPGTVETLNGLGATLNDSGQRAAGLEIYRRVLAIEERRRGLDHLDLFPPLNNLGNALINAGELAEADTHLTRARALLERHGQSEAPDYALLLYNLGALRLESGAPAQALPHLARSLALREQIYGPEHHDTGDSLALLAEAELAAGQLGPATAHAERALALLEKWPRGVLESGRVRFVLARLRWRDPRARREALALARRAAQDLGSQTGDTGVLAEVRAWLAARGE